MAMRDAAVEEMAAAPEAEQGERPGLLRMLGQVLLLDGAGYAAVREDRTPLRRGFAALLLVLGLVGLARLIGLGLGLLAAPQLGSLQQILGDFITGLPWYAQQVQADPQFASQFQLGYAAGWDAVRLFLGVPVPLAVASLYLLFAVVTLLNWLIYGLLVHLFARWLGGQARLGQTLGVTALAYAPLLLFSVELVPGAVLPVSLLFAYLLVTKFMAVAAAHGLHGGRALAAVLAPYLLAFVILAAAALFGGAYSLDQVPALDQTLQMAPLFGVLTGLR